MKYITLIIKKEYYIFMGLMIDLIPRIINRNLDWVRRSQCIKDKTHLESFAYKSKILTSICQIRFAAPQSCTKDNWEYILCPNIPFWEDLVHSEISNPGSEAFVEPEMVPPKAMQYKWLDRLWTTGHSKNNCSSRYHSIVTRLPNHYNEIRLRNVLALL
jgi:hypothetical protein